MREQEGLDLSQIGVILILSVVRSSILRMAKKSESMLGEMSYGDVL